ncbi:S-layer homology domain-containing protein [Candidatus Peregrinibacteria bacterium]|nr:S-layer homology domain-containing protein [Candidatus Peregrinibacteria bacterium]
MKIMHSLKMLFLPLIIFGTIVLPNPSLAADSFSPTVLIISFRYFLNGEIEAVSAGTGTIISTDGDILTNAHVIYDDDLNRPWDAFAICVSQNMEDEPKCQFTASLKRYDEKIDLALLTIDRTPVLGTLPSSFASVSYKEKVEPAVGDSVYIRGFPSSGGNTMTVTKGQVSGTTEVNGYKYLKTDADIDAGNSGGMMYDDEGNFVGVPSYIVSYYENSGRALHISEVAKWVDSTAGDKGSVNSEATRELRSQYARFYKIQDEGQITYKTDPKISAKLPDGWEFLTIGNSGFSLYKKNNAQAVIAVLVSSNGHKLNMSLQEKKDVLDKLDIYDYTDYQFTKVQDTEALHLWNKNPDETTHVMILSHGYKEIDITYNIPKYGETEALKDVNQFLADINFASPDEDDPTPSYLLDEDDYPISFESSPDWRVVQDDLSGSQLAYVLRNTKKIEGMEVTYEDLAEDHKEIKPDEILEYFIDETLSADAEVTYKSDKLMIDGLPGWIFIYKYKNGDLPLKKVQAGVIDTDHVYYFDYHADTTIFDEGLQRYVSILKSVKTKTNEGNGTFKIPTQIDVSEEGFLSDITGHRYKTSIENLMEMEVISGYPDGTFKPENPVNRAEALKIILQSLRAMQAEEGEDTFVMPENFNMFSDLQPTEWYATYVAEGVDKGIINGYPDGTFKGGNTVNLAEALKMTLEAHETKVWDGDTSPWYKKYFDAAYGLDVLPQDLSDPGKLLTRAELAYIVDQLVNQN